jgi:large subunit ribosomal protein L18
MNLQKQKAWKRERRHLRVRRTVSGTPERPRLSVFRSLENIYCQLIDDTQGKTLVAFSTLSPELRESLKKRGNKGAAAMVGTKLAEKALAAGIKQAVLDRGGYKYHGRVKALADAARKGGLKF